MTGGVCKEQGHIHRKMITSDYYRFRCHEAELQASIYTTTAFRGLAPPFGVASHCHSLCCARVAQKIRGIRTCRSLHLPPGFPGSLHSVLAHSYECVSNDGYRSRSLPDLTGHLTARADGGHAPPLGSSAKPFRLSIILPSPLVRFSALNTIKPHAAPVVVLPRQFL